MELTGLLERMKLDHLAARMRRNAESLLVLADEGSTNVRARPVSMTDMIRVAIGEVEQYHRVEVLSVDDAMVKGAAASGMSHLLAELLDNATSFSPPDSSVRLGGRRAGDSNSTWRFCTVCATPKLAFFTDKPRLVKAALKSRF